MTMTPDEIYADYRDAKDKLSQIGIMAELNMCEKAEVIKILEDMGVDVSEAKPKKRTYRKRAKSEEQVTEKPQKRKTEQEESSEKQCGQQAADKKPRRQQAMPRYVREKIVERITVLSEQIDDLEKELKELDDYLKEANAND